MVNLSLWNRKYILNHKKLWLLILKSYSNLSPRPYMIFVSQGFSNPIRVFGPSPLGGTISHFFNFLKISNLLKEIQTANTARPPTYHGQCLSLSALFTQGIELIYDMNRMNSGNFSVLIFWFLLDILEEKSKKLLWVWIVAFLCESNLREITLNTIFVISIFSNRDLNWHSN